MIIGVPTETFPDERRTALVPGVIPSLTKCGLEVLVEPGLGEQAGLPDRLFVDKGAHLAAGRNDLFARADIILQVRTPSANPIGGAEDLSLMREGQTVIGLVDPLTALEPLQRIAERKVCCFSLELLPRITRAQSMDVLSSQANIAGYKAVILAAEALPRLFPMLMTAAGTMTAAKVFVIGAGVAGLQAIATARRLGAVVQAYDVRSATKEQVQSLGAKFVELAIEDQVTGDRGTGDRGAEDKGGYAKAMDEMFYRKQRELLGAVVAASDVVITTAAVPGKKAPVLVNADMVQRMAPGSVIVDLAAERGGNCELTRAGETVHAHGVAIFGPLNLPATVAFHASQMFAKNISTFVLSLVREGKLAIDLADEIHRETLVTRDGSIVNERVKQVFSV